jgi:hypothetical protein
METNKIIIIIIIIIIIYYLFTYLLHGLRANYKVNMNKDTKKKYM